MKSKDEPLDYKSLKSVVSRSILQWLSKESPNDLSCAMTPNSNTVNESVPVESTML
jgi:hypothetical protein